MKPLLSPVPRRQCRRSRSGLRPRGDDLHVGLRTQRFDRGHRERVRFFAGRGGIAPDAQRPAGAQLQRLGEHLEVMRLAEERRQVGGQAVDELLPFVGGGVAGRGVQPLQVGAERAVAGFAQAA